jgi:tRNA threonylcarbamoyladenosine biosynthesis protein TsaB
LKRILALDTSTWWGSVALIERIADGRPAGVVAEVGERIDDSHAEHLLEWIARVLAEAGWPKTSIDAYAATRGPGSFTGVRVGLGTIRGLGLAADRPCIGVTTLEAIAEAHGRDDRERFPVMDAGRGELYAARYDARSSPPAERTPPWLGGAADVLGRVATAGGRAIAGPGTQIEIANEAAAPGVVLAPLRLAGAAGRVAAFRGETPQPLAPLYIRPPDALLKRPRS